MEEESKTEAVIKKLEKALFNEGDSLVLIGCGAVQFIGVLDTENKGFDQVVLFDAGVVIINRAIAEAGIGMMKLMKQVFIASPTFGSGPQKETIRHVDFYQVPSTDFSREDYLVVLREYDKFLGTSDKSKEYTGESRIIDPNVAAAVAESFIRGRRPTKP